jgi:hypothetical protein
MAGLLEREGEQAPSSGEGISTDWAVAMMPSDCATSVSSRYT